MNDASRWMEQPPPPGGTELPPTRIAGQPQAAPPAPPPAPPAPPTKRRGDPGPYRVGYEADFVEAPRNRWTVGFRYILALPWLIVAQILGIAVLFTVFIAWFGMLFTGRYAPESFYRFHAGYLRFQGRVSGWLMLQTDEWPPFWIDEEPQYPIRVPVAPAQERYSRAKVFFRLILAFPIYVVASLLPYITLTAAFAAWLNIVFRGYMPAGLHNAISLGQAYTTRVTAYFLLLTETIPPISQQAPAGALHQPTVPAS